MFSIFWTTGICWDSFKKKTLIKLCHVFVVVVFIWFLYACVHVIIKMQTKNVIFFELKIFVNFLGLHHGILCVIEKYSGQSSVLIAKSTILYIMEHECHQSSANQNWLLSVRSRTSGSKITTDSDVTKVLFSYTYI
jgi:hypothetical protein